MDNLYWFEEQGVYDSTGIGHFANYILMQYTGLKDKNGKEIYEGDIIQLEGKTLFKVYYSDTSACYRVERQDGWHFDLKELFPIDYWQVVGNIYETPELLSK
jgi:uncharacterized phage protein (TIGR01671 family)